MLTVERQSKEKKKDCRLCKRTFTLYARVASIQSGTENARLTLRKGNLMVKSLKLKVNGKERTFDGDPYMPLLWYVRDVLGLTGTKFGFGVALCGACTAVFGTSIARNGEITAKNGAIQQSNFNDYPVARITEAPAQTNVYIMESSTPPAGVGEPGVPRFVAAFCPAIIAAMGKRVRDLPLSSNNLFA
jgi:hypothetical protein